MHPEIIDALIGVHEATANLQFPLNAYSIARPIFLDGLACESRFRTAMEAYGASYDTLYKAMEKHGGVDPDIDIYADRAA